MSQPTAAHGRHSTKHNNNTYTYRLSQATRTRPTYRTPTCKLSLESSVKNICLQTDNDL